MNSATKAAKKLMIERGFIVLGFPPTAKNKRLQFRPGDRFGWFAGQQLDDGYELQITGPSNRGEWIEQAEYLGPQTAKRDRRRNPPTNGEQFFRCALETDES